MHHVQDKTVGKGFYDAFAIDTMWSLDLALAGYLESLDNYVANDARLDWTDFFACVYQRQSCCVCLSLISLLLPGGRARQSLAFLARLQGVALLCGAVQRIHRWAASQRPAATDVLPP